MPYCIRANFTPQSLLLEALDNMCGELERRKHVWHGDILPIVAFMAFSFEAYLNSVGSRVLVRWDEIERIRWREKVVVLHALAQRDLDWGAEPLQFLQKLFGLRDKLAHGKPEIVRTGCYSSLEEAEAAMDAGGWTYPEWYLALDREWVVTARRKLVDAMMYLGSMHGFAHDDHHEYSQRQSEPVSDV